MRGLQAGWAARTCLASRHARSRAYARSRSPAYCSGATFWLGAPDGRLLTCGRRGAVCREVRRVVCGGHHPGTSAAPVTYVRRRASYPAPQARGKQAGTRTPQAHGHSTTALLSTQVRTQPESVGRHAPGQASGSGSARAGGRDHGSSASIAPQPRRVSCMPTPTLHRRGKNAVVGTVEER